MNAPRIAAALISCVLLGALPSAHAGIVAEEATTIGLLQMIALDSHVIASIEGDKARLDITVKMKSGGSSADGEPTHAIEIHRLDRGVVYSLIEPSRQYRENKLGSPLTAVDSSRQIAAIADALECQWNTVEVAKTKVGRETVGGAAATHVRIDASHRCVPGTAAAPSCTLGLTYDQWSARPDALHAQFARYRRDFAAQAGNGSGNSEEFMLFIQFGVPVDPALLESVRKATAALDPALKTSAVLRASRSCFAQTRGASGAATAAGAQSDSPSVMQFVGAMLLAAWVAEKDAQPAGGMADRPETVGTLTTEITAIRAQQFPESQFELPAGFTQAF